MQYSNKKLSYPCLHSFSQRKSIIRTITEQLSLRFKPQKLSHSYIYHQYYQLLKSSESREWCNSKKRHRDWHKLPEST